MTDIDVQAIIAELKQQKVDAEKLRAENVKNLTGMLKTLMVSTPEVEAIRWQQYTPYFNDGDECVFSIQDIEVKFNAEKFPMVEEKDGDEAYDNNDGFVQSWQLDDFFARQEDVLMFKSVAAVEAQVQILIDLHEELTAFGDQMHAAFGDHARVTVTRAGITTEQYDHD